MQRSYINAECLRWMFAGALAVFCILLGPVGPQALWAQGGLTVRSVAVGGAASQPEIEVKISGPVAPATQSVTGPDRIVIDFPGALPASTLRALHVHRGSLKGIRTGLFQSQPPITRVVLDVDGPTDYQVMPSGSSIVIKLGRSGPASSQTSLAPAPRHPVSQRSASLRATSPVPALQITNTVAVEAPAEAAPAPPPKPKIDVGVRSNLLSIRAEGATLAEVLYEVHRRTGAEIAIPAGAEQERVVVNMGPAPGKEVIASLLNGSRFNYILLGNDADPGGFRNLLLSLKSGGNSGVFVHSTPPQFASGALQGQPPAVTTAPDPGAEQAVLPQAEPELEPVPDEPPAAEPDAETNPNNQRPGMPQQFPVQNIPDAGQPPQ